MVQLTTEQRVFIVLHYTQTQNTTAVQNEQGFLIGILLTKQQF